MYTKTLPIYLNCVRRRVAKILLNQRIHPVRVSVCPSRLSICLFFHAFLLQTKCAGINLRQEPDRGPIQPQFHPQSAPVAHPPTSECKYKSSSRPKKKGGDNPSKEDLAVINVAYSSLSKNLRISSWNRSAHPTEEPRLEETEAIFPHL